MLYADLQSNTAMWLEVQPIAVFTLAPHYVGMLHLLYYLHSTVTA